MEQKALTIDSPKQLFLSVIILLMTMTVLSACGNSGYSKYFPEPSVGRSQEYHISVHTPSGIQTFTGIERVEGKEKINGKTYYKTVTIYQDLPGAEPDLSYERYTNDGIYAVDTDDPQQQEYLDIPFPLEEGMSWTISDSNSQLDVFFEGVEDVYLPDKTYQDCVKLSVTGFDDGEPISMELYFAKDVGLVRDTGTYAGMEYERILVSDE